MDTATNKMYKAYNQGYKAFKMQQGVNTCKYLTDVNGQQNGTIASWLDGWQDAFNDFMGNFSNNN